MCRWDNTKWKGKKGKKRLSVGGFKGRKISCEKSLSKLYMCSFWWSLPHEHSCAVDTLSPIFLYSNYSETHCIQQNSHQSDAFFCNLNVTKITERSCLELHYFNPNLNWFEVFHCYGCIYMFVTSGCLFIVCLVCSRRMVSIILNQTPQYPFISHMWPWRIARSLSQINENHVNKTCTQRYCGGE